MMAVRRTCAPCLTWLISVLLVLASSAPVLAQRGRGGGSRAGRSAPRQSAPARSASPRRSDSAVDKAGDRGGASSKRNLDSGNQKSNGDKNLDVGSNRRGVDDNQRGADNDRRGVDNNQRGVDNSRRNVNVNVDNSTRVQMNQRNTYVRANTRPYTRAPYRYGGRSYYSFHSYAYHPYHGYSWGPSWHPWGFFVATLAATAIVVTVANQQYKYDQGVYYVASDGGYTAVAAPVGATVPTLPEKAQPVVVNETTNNYYYGGTYYEKSKDGYTVVAPTAGTVVENLPEGGKEVKVGDQKYVQVGDTYYQPIKRDGKDMYEVVEVKEGK
jgi:hypothetical protein